MPDCNKQHLYPKWVQIFPLLLVSCYAWYSWSVMCKLSCVYNSYVDLRFSVLQDGFVLVGSVAGQRYWSSMLTLDSTITCGIWTPDDQQVSAMWSK